MTEKRPPRAAEFAWDAGDRPGPLGFSAVVAEPVRNAMLQALPPEIAPRDGQDAWIGGLTEAPGPAGRYRLKTDQGEWFLRLTARWGDPDLESEIMAHLERSGAPVNPVLACGLTVAVPGEAEPMRLDIRPFLTGAEHFSDGEPQLRSLGQALGQVHAALRTFPGSARVQTAARERQFRWDRLHCAARDDPRRLAEELPPYSAWLLRHRDWIAETARACPPSAVLEADDAQCVHGEPHRANVMFQAGRAVLLDFEEAVHLYASPRWDLAFAVQRFMLPDAPDPAALRARLAALEAGYGAAAPLDPEAMQTVAWCTLLAIMDNWCEAKIAVPPKELEKFQGFRDQAVKIEILYNETA